MVNSLFESRLWLMVVEMLGLYTLEKKVAFVVWTGTFESDGLKTMYWSI